MVETTPPSTVDPGAPRTDPDPPLTFDDHKLYFDLLRSYVIHEDNLIGARTSWFINLTGFLVAGLSLGPAATSLVANGFQAPAFWLFTLLISVIGAAIGSTTYVSIRAADRSICGLRELWDQYAAKNGLSKTPPGKRNFPNLTGGGGPVETPRLGKVSSFLLPMLFTVVWLSIGSLSVAVWWTEGAILKDLLSTQSEEVGPADVGATVLPRIRMEFCINSCD